MQTHRGPRGCASKSVSPMSHALIVQTQSNLDSRRCYASPIIIQILAWYVLGRKHLSNLPAPGMPGISRKC